MVLRTQRQVRQKLLAKSQPGKARSLMDYRWALSEPPVSRQKAAPGRLMAKISRLLSRPVF